MQKQIFFQNQNIAYTIKVSKRAKRIRLSVGLANGVVLTLPSHLNSWEGEKFLKSKIGWLVKSLKHFKKFTGISILNRTKLGFVKNKTQALELAEKKVFEWNKVYNFPFKKICVKNQKTRWGSCSKKGNLNFNCRIIFLPQSLLDYLVVHELCHLKEFNHSKNFWTLVSQSIPDYKARRKEIRQFSF